MSTRLPPPLAELLDLPEESRRIGAFRLVRQLGRGGFAPVWLAKEVFGGEELRTAAVKLFSLTSPDFDPQRASQASAAARHKDQVIREAQALCKVEHPNVVRFYSMAVDEARGVVGLAMEYVTGTPLDRRIAEAGKLDVEQTLDVGVAVASALAAVHRTGLVHRDVKPPNVVDAGGVHKLIDFGIASADAREGDAPPREKRARKVVLDDLPIEVVGTKMSMLAAAYTIKENGDGATSEEEDAPLLLTGTVGYIDPVCVATGAPATPASDLYALGATLYECLTGKLPAHASAPVGTGLAGEVLDGRAPPRAIRELMPDVPERLARIVDALLDPAREKRPASAQQVADELQAMRDAGRTSTALLPSAPPAPRRAANGFFVAIAVAAIAAVGGVLWLQRGADRAKEHLVSPSSSASAAAIAPRPCSAADPSDCALQCDRGSAESCYALGILEENGNGTPRDLTKAVAAYTRACDGGSGAACYALGRMLEPKDPSAALARYRQGCDARNPQACNSVGRFSSEGLAGAPDGNAAFGFYSRACEGGYAVGCSNLGLLYERGEGTQQDEARAHELYAKACEGGASSACANLAWLEAEGRGGPKDEAHAVGLFTKGCDAGTPQACAGLAAMLADGRGVTKDEARAAELYQRACDAQVASACSGRALLLLRGPRPDWARAAAFYERACDGHDAEGCRALATLYLHGRGVHQDGARARALYAEACDGGACGERAVDENDLLRALGGAAAKPGAGTGGAAPADVTPEPAPAPMPARAPLPAPKPADLGY